MSVKKDPSGRRYVEVEVEVPGTPEQVWRAIASGPGISAWFVPATIEGKVGGTATHDFGGGMVSSAKITAWEPPHRFAAEDAWIQGGPPIATEWTVEARGSGKCVVRVVHSLFASTDQWDDQIGSTESGWPAFFAVLRHYLAHHAGEPSATIQTTAFTAGDPQSAWQKIASALALSDARKGSRVDVALPGAARMRGTVDGLQHYPHGIGLRAWLTEPAPGAALLGAYTCMGMLMVSAQIYFYGARAEAAAGDRKAWQDWLAVQFPAPQPATPAS